MPVLFKLAILFLVINYKHALTQMKNDMYIKVLTKASL